MKAGIVAVVGKPNVGKSTLLNRVVGQKLSIMSPKPQTTRERVFGILTTDDVQIVLVDTPGLLNPRYALQRAMRGIALETLQGADVVVYLSDAQDGAPPSLEAAAELESPVKTSVLTVLNKIDTLETTEREQLRAALPDAFFISALLGEGVEALVAGIVDHLPESPLLYPADDIGTQSMRFFVSELIRETALEQLEEEVPYSVACEVEEFREDRAPMYIRAVIYVERETQKRILIGSRGAQIRDLGRVSRMKIEELVGAPVYLDLWVKVLRNWRRNVRALRRFGFTVAEEEKR